MYANDMHTPKGPWVDEAGAGRAPAELRGRRAAQVRRMTTKRLLHLFLYLSWFYLVPSEQTCKLVNTEQFSDSSVMWDMF